MPGRPEGTEDEWASDERPARSRRPLFLVVALVGLLAMAAGAFTLLRDDGGAADEVTTDITFGPEGDATTIPPVPAGGNSVLQANADVGAAGSKVTVQGAGFKSGRDFRPVELHWDTIAGKPLQTADGPRFSVEVTIPADAQVLTEGHNIIAVQRTKDGEIDSQVSVRFFVDRPRP